MAEFIHLLYVDDNPLDRELVREVLNSALDAFQLTEAKSCWEFEALLAQDRYDLVLSDLDILGCNGLQLLDLVRAKNPALPVIILSGSGSEEIAVTTMKQGAADYVIKTPQHLQRLPATILRILQQKRKAAKQQQVDGVSTDITQLKQSQTALSRYTAQLRGLAQASAVINASLSISEILATITEQAQTLIGAHQAVVSLTEGEHWAQAIQHISFSDKYAAWQDYDKAPDGSGIYALVCQTNRSMRLTQAELEAHPAWRGFGWAAGHHPPMRGWLAVPLIDREGRNMGLIQLSDKYEGEFTVDDEMILLQLAQIAQVAIENARLLEAEHTAQEQLRNLTRYLHAVREDERTEIAREIHDELGQALTALKMDLAWLTKRLPDDPAVRQRSDAANQLINSTIRTVQHIAAELRPGLLDDLGLVPALEWQAHQFSERTSIDCRLVVANPGASLGRERDTVIFRIFQETLTNVGRHAAASRVEAELKDRPDGLTLTVRDNGRGITESQLTAPSSLGLLGMQERAHAWGGHITFTGRPGQGTAVTLFLPRPTEEAVCD